MIISRDSSSNKNKNKNKNSKNYNAISTVINRIIFDNDNNVTVSM
jgi:hypothetical protein